MKRLILLCMSIAAMTTAACSNAPQRPSTSGVKDLIGDGSDYFSLNDWGANGLGATTTSIIDPSFQGALNVLTSNSSICFDEASSLNSGNGFLLYNCAFRNGNIVWGPEALFLKRGAVVGNPAGDFYLTTADGVSVGILHSTLGLQQRTYYSLAALCSGPVATACDLSYGTATAEFLLNVR